MKVIYTCKTMEKIPLVRFPLFLEVSKLSLDMANKFYRTELYCDNESKDFFVEHEYPFDEIIVLPELEEFSGEIFSIPKLITYTHQNEPYIHLDLDTILLDKIEFSDSVMFGFFDGDYRGLNDFEYKPFIKEDYVDMFENNLKTHFKPEQYLTWGWEVFPNSCLFGVNDFGGVSESYSNILRDFKMLLLSEDPGAKLATFLEQFMIINQLDKKGIDYSCLTPQNSFFALEPSFELTDDVMEEILSKKFIHLHHFHRHPIETMSYILDNIIKHKL